MFQSVRGSLGRVGSMFGQQLCASGDENSLLSRVDVRVEEA